MHYEHIKGQIIEIIDATLQELGCSEDLRLRLALEECVQNVADYAYEADGELTVITEKSASSVTITLEDAGVPFNPLQAEEPDINAPIEERKTGGLGIFLASQIMDRMSYAYQDGKNILTMVYKLPEPPAEAEKPQETTATEENSATKTKTSFITRLFAKGKAFLTDKLLSRSKTFAELSAFFRRIEVPDDMGDSKQSSKKKYSKWYFVHKTYQIFFLPLVVLAITSILIYGKVVFSKIELDFYYRYSTFTLNHIMDVYHREGTDAAKQFLADIPYSAGCYFVIVDKNGESLLNIGEIYDQTQEKLHFLGKQYGHQPIRFNHTIFMAISCYREQDEVYILTYIPLRTIYLQFINFSILIMLIGCFSILLSMHIFRKTIAPLINHIISNDERMKTELDIAHNLQLSSVPVEFPQDELVDMSAVLQPAREVGGDFYSFFIYEDKHKYLYFIIGDVSDKGVSSALMMAASLCLFNQIAELGLPLLETIKQMNNAIYRRNTHNMFCTLFVARLDMNTLEMSYINAGHNAPLLNREPIKVVPNLPIGLVREFPFQEQHLKMKRGDMFVLYTDGVTEAKNQQNEFYELKRTIASIPVHANATDTTQSILNGVLEFRGDAAQNDDITIFSIGIKDAPNEV